MPGIALRNAAKCFGDSASQSMMISFHLPPIAASAAVRGQPPTGLGRVRFAPFPGSACSTSLPGGAFLIALIRQITFWAKILGEVKRTGEVMDDSRSEELPDQAR